MSPFTNKVGLSSILTPLKVCKKLPSISIYLTAHSRDQSMIINQINILVPTILANKLSVYFCTSESMEEDYLPHAKLLIVDSKRGYLGSANFTKQGLTSRFEVAVELNEQQSKCVGKLLLKLEEKGLFIKHNNHD
jgi:phosphatidylserine/phosphatidylglycerophosphate/cardiolipin synthase-like enzyme